MKKITIILAAALFVMKIYCQAPNTFNYQPVLRDVSGKVKENTEWSNLTL